MTVGYVDADQLAELLESDRRWTSIEEDIENDAVAAGVVGSGRRRRRILAVDCRPFTAFNIGHVVDAVNVYCPAIVRRRSGGAVPIGSLVRSAEVLDDLVAGRYEMVVVYDEASCCDVELLDNGSDVKMSLDSLLKVLTPDLVQVCLLRGGFTLFSERYCHLCTSSAALLEPYSVITNVPNSARRTRSEIRNISSPFVTPPCTDTVRLNPVHDQNGDPVQLLPWLYLGNSSHAARRSRLRQLGITALLNVASADVPPLSADKDCGATFTCLSLPIADTCTADIAEWFPDCFSFIESVRQSSGTVLVYCHAGISRSAAICIAYLMQHKQMSMDEAHDFVKTRRAFISPNLNFMRQLHEFDIKLQMEKQRCSSSMASCTVTRSPLSSPNTGAECGVRSVCSPRVALGRSSSLCDNRQNLPVPAHLERFQFAVNSMPSNFRRSAAAISTLSPYRTDSASAKRSCMLERCIDTEAGRTSSSIGLLSDGSRVLSDVEKTPRQSGTSRTRYVFDFSSAPSPMKVTTTGNLISS